MNEEISKHIQIREVLGLEGIEGEIISLIKENKEEFKVFMSGGSSAGNTAEETDPLSLHLDQTTPQTITGGVPIGLEGSYTHKITFNMIGTAGEQAWVQIPYDCTITSYELTADQSGSIVLDLWVDTYGNFPPTVADTITASAKPTLSSAQKTTDSTLTGWTKALTAGKYILANVDSASTLEKAVLTLNVTRS